jgi:triacylglycerol lipase
MIFYAQNSLKKLYFVLSLLILLIFTYACRTKKDISISKPCATKYPIILVHGISFRDDFPVIKYWSQLPKALEKNGARVYLSNTKAFGSHVENAIILRERILEILEETGSEKVNIIAHSKGGLESRYMITKLDMANRVASLTTLATPHRGSYIADTILIWLRQNNWLDKIISIANKYGKFIGDKNPEALQAAENLTIKYMKNFNQSVPDVSGVLYQSTGGIISNEYPIWLVRIQEKVLSEKEGQSDGTVSLKSYQWGNYLGIAKSDQDFGVSHFDIVGMKFVSKQSTFDAEGFIVEIAKSLKEKGL